MKLKQILFLTFVFGQSLVHAASPQFYSSIDELQKNVDLYADSMMHAKYDNQYQLSGEPYPSTDQLNSEHPGEFDQFASSFITTQNYELLGVSSSDLVKYLRQTVGQSGDLNSALNNLKIKANQLYKLNPEKFATPGSGNPVKYTVDSALQNSNPTLPNTDEPSGPGVATGTGASTSAAEQAYNQALIQYQGQVKTAEGLQQLQNQLSTLDANVASLQLKISQAKQAQQDISDLDAELTQALADQVAARDAISKAGETPIDEVS